VLIERSPGRRSSRSFDDPLLACGAIDQVV
jgi:hypothetical protein